MYLSFIEKRNLLCSLKLKQLSRSSPGQFLCKARIKDFPLTTYYNYSALLYTQYLEKPNFKTNLYTYIYSYIHRALCRPRRRPQGGACGRGPGPQARPSCARPDSARSTTSCPQTCPSCPSRGARPRRRTSDTARAASRSARGPADPPSRARFPRLPASPRMLRRQKSRPTPSTLRARGSAVSPATALWALEPPEIQATNQLYDLQYVMITSTCTVHINWKAEFKVAMHPAVLTMDNRYRGSPISLTRNEPVSTSSAHYVSSSFAFLIL